MAATAHQDDLTIVVPIFNEAPCLDHFRSEMDAFLAQTPVKTSVLFVNDGSTDDSQEMIERMCRADERYGFICLTRNSGLSTALKAGFDHCSTTLCGYIDADVQTTPLDFMKFLEFFPQYDLVNGIRADRNDSVVKKISSRVANTVRRAMIDDNIEDTCCPLKILKSDFAHRIPFFDGMHRFIPALVQLEGGTVKQTPVRHFPRYAGTAKYNLKNRLIGPFLDTLAFVWMKKRYIRYGISKKSG